MIFCACACVTKKENALFFLSSFFSFFLSFFSIFFLSSFFSLGITVWVVDVLTSMI